MADILHSLPRTAGVVGDAARQLGLLIGPALQAPDGSVYADDLLGLGSAMAALRATTSASLAEAFLSSADQLLSEWEIVFDLPVRPDLSDAARQALLLARARAVKGGTAQYIKAALDLLATTPVIIAEGYADALAVPPQRPDGGTVPPYSQTNAFLFAVILSASDYANVPLRAQMSVIIDIMRPAHVGYVFASPDFLFDTAGHGFDAGALE